MRILLLSTADTDLLAARACGAGYRVANPARTEPAALPALLDGVDIVVLRLLGGRRAWEPGLEVLLRAGLPAVCLGGEATPDAELMAASTVPAGVAAEALRYLVAGGSANLAELARFLSDTVLLTGEGFEPPAPTPEYGVHDAREPDPGLPTVDVSCSTGYRSQGRSPGTTRVARRRDPLGHRCRVIELSSGIRASLRA